MKKILAFILSVIMLLSVMPVAFAAQFEYPHEVEHFFDIFARIESYGDNKYEDNSVYRNKIRVILDSALDAFEDLGYDSAPPLDKDNDYTDVSWFSDFNKCMQPAIDNIESKIASGEIKVLINVYECYKYEFYLQWHYDMEKAAEIVDNQFFLQNPIYAEMYDKINNFDFVALLENSTTQAEFDAGWKENCVPFNDMLMDCLDGNHPYGEYISNNDATEEADGTKTAVCEFCGATDTVTDEGSKLVKEPASFFERLIALIKAFFEKILSIFA